MEIIPAIDILDGKCVRLYQGDYAQAQTFDENPVSVARQWAAEGATRLHLVDLDGAKVGQSVNLAVIDAIVSVVNERSWSAGDLMAVRPTSNSWLLYHSFLVL